MQKSLVLLTLLFIFFNSSAQFYYNDVVDLQASNKIYANLMRNNIKEITATSTESDGLPTNGFAYLKTIKNNGSTVVTHTELETGGISDDVDTYVNGLIARSEDSADKVRTTIEYVYDGNGRIVQLQTQTDDTTMNTHSTELHKWFYTGEMPDSMIRIKDKTDSTIIRFKKDAQNNIAEELWIKKGRLLEHYFYYYNDAGLLTDIVRFNIKAQQMLPDYLLEYDEKGRLSQLTQIPQGSSGYVIWKYVYDERGLKIKDVLFDKYQELLGTVSYTYR